MEQYVLLLEKYGNNVKFQFFLLVLHFESGMPETWDKRFKNGPSEISHFTGLSLILCPILRTLSDIYDEGFCESS